MWDAGMIAMGVTFFAIAIAYVRGCDLLSHSNKNLDRETAK
jgi:hypothetical protein